MKTLAFPIWCFLLTFETNLYATRRKILATDLIIEQAKSSESEDNKKELVEVHFRALMVDLNDFYKDGLTNNASSMDKEEVQIGISFRPSTFFPVMEPIKAAVKIADRPITWKPIIKTVFRLLLALHLFNEHRF